MKLLPALALVGAVLVPSPPVQAQATRTWVSGVGDDANPCSRTAPCKTFAGAISKTAANGEINVLDPGGFGGVTINKSLTIQACNSEGGVLVSGTNAIVVNAGVNDRVTLRCLDINGLGTGLDGIRILAGKTVKITDTEIYGFTRNGIAHASTTPGSRLFVTRSFIRDVTGAAVMISPPSGSSAVVGVRNNDFVATGCGVVATQFGVSNNFAVDCGTNGPNGGTGISAVNNIGNFYTENAAAAVLSRGASSFQRIGNNQIVSNGTGLQALDGGSILSFGGNFITGNGTNGSPTGPNIPPVAP